MIKQYRNPLSVGDTVRITGDYCHGLTGEIKAISPHSTGEDYSVYVDAVEQVTDFRADEIERVDLEVNMAELPF